ncbi:MAG TPA: glycosyltransferase family 39 protein [Chloroflexota bacterium]|nr:glycosyltransferase family 39 protein [Chloroflexota bacterium]
MRRYLILVAANLLVAVALIWATREQLVVRIVVANGTATGYVGGTKIVAPIDGSATGQVGLFLQGADSHAPFNWPDPGAGGPPSPSLGGDLYRLAAESAWAHVNVTSSDGQLLFSSDSPKVATNWIPRSGDWFHHLLGGETTATPGLLTFGSANWTEYQITADLLRPRNAAGILVLSPDGSNGMLFYFRPEDRDVNWYRVVNGQWQGPVASAPYRSFAQDIPSETQDTLRLALGGYPGAVAIVGVVLLLGLLDGVTLSRWVRWPSPLALSALRLRSGSGGVASLAAAAVVGAGLAAGLYVAAVVLQGMPHVQDSVAYLFQAKTYALGRLWVPVPAHSEFFTHEFIVMHDGRWFGKYPPGWPMLLAIGVLAGAPWVVSPICGALALLVVYRIGREVYHPWVGVLAAILGLAAPFWLFLSGSMMSHASGLLFSLLFIWGFWRTSRSDKPVWPGLLAGLALGVGVLIRPYTVLMIAIPFALYAAISLIPKPIPALRRYLPIVVGAAPFVVAFCAYNAYFTGHLFYPPQQLWWPFDQVGFGPDHGPFGFYPVDAFPNVSRNLQELLEHAFGWPTFLTLSLAFLPFVSGRARMWDWLLGASFVCLTLGYAFWWADGIMFGPRFYYEGFGALLLLTARGVQEALSLTEQGARVLSKRAGDLGLPMARGAVIAGLIGLIAFNYVYYFPLQWDLYHGYNYVNHSKLDAVAAAGIHHAVVFADVGEWYAWWEYGMVFSANDPLLQGDVIFARDLGTPKDLALEGDFPGRSFYRLEGTTITPLN